MRAKRVHGMHSRTSYNRTIHHHHLRSEPAGTLVTPKHTRSQGSMRCQQHARLSVHRPPSSLPLLGTKPVRSTALVAAALPMPVASCAKIALPSSVARVRWPPAWPRRVLHVVSACLPQTDAHTGSCTWPLALQRRTMPPPGATPPSAHSSSSGGPPLGLPWPHRRRSRAWHTASHAPRCSAWLWW
jgi:hypothetical protein